MGRTASPLRGCPATLGPLAHRPANLVAFRDAETFAVHQLPLFRASSAAGHGGRCAARVTGGPSGSGAHGFGVRRRAMRKAAQQHRAEFRSRLNCRLMPGLALSSSGETPPQTKKPVAWTGSSFQISCLLKQPRGAAVPHRKPAARRRPAPATQVQGPHCRLRRSRTS